MTRSPGGPGRRKKIFSAALAICCTWGGVVASSARAFAAEPSAVSGSGLIFTSYFEGSVSTVYDDPDDYCTIGVGHLIATETCAAEEAAKSETAAQLGLSVCSSDTGTTCSTYPLTTAEMDSMLLDDMAVRVGPMLASIDDASLTQGQFDAVMDFVFNAGQGSFADSTIHADIVAGDYSAVPAAFMLWAPSSCSTSPGVYYRRESEAYLFATGEYAYFDSCSQTVPIRMPGTGFPIQQDGPPAATVTSGSTAYVFWKGADGGLWEAQGGADGQLDLALDIGDGPLGSQPAVGVNASGDTYVYWEGADGNLWEAYWTGTGWTSAIDQGMGPLGSPPAVAVTASGEAYVFWTGTNGSLWEAEGPGNGHLTGPYSLGDGPLGSQPTAGVNASGDTYVYWKGTDGNLWEAYWTGTGWTGPINQGMGPLGSQPSVTLTPSGEAYVFWKGMDGNLWQAIGAADGRLSGPDFLGDGPLGSAPTAGANGSGATYVYWEGTDGNLWEAYWTGAQWSVPIN